jgi:hypothetical protein
MSEEVKDYEVGYGKPPKHTRFRKGRSGNPKGRPKGAKGVRASLKRELVNRITVREGNREICISKAEALAKQLIARALKGDMKAIAELLKLDPELFADATGGEEMEGSSLLPDSIDIDILRDFLSELPAEDNDSENREVDNEGA